MAPARPAIRARLVDLAITVAVAVVIEVTIEVAREPGSRPPGGVGHALGILMALPLLVRRRWPVATVYASSAILVGYYAANYPGFPPTVVLLAQLYFAAEAGRVRQVLPVPIFFFTVGTYVGLRHGDAVLSLVDGLLPHIALVTVAVLLGALVHNRRQLAAETQERLRLAAEERDREAARRVAQERLRIARELHDTVAHAMATIAVQSGTALHVLDERPDQARDALVAIRATGKAALEELRTTLGVLREGDEAAALTDRTAGLDRLPALLDAVRAAGLDVTVERSGTSGALPSTVDHVGYRILQEALTNVLRHAGPDAAATVRLGYAPGALTVEVVDDGAGAPPGRPGPAGAPPGMRERAESLGGTLDAGPHGSGGYAVRALLPFRGAAA